MSLKLSTGNNRRQFHQSTKGNKSVCSQLIDVMIEFLVSQQKVTSKFEVNNRLKLLTVELEPTSGFLFDWGQAWGTLNGQFVDTKVIQRWQQTSLKSINKTLFSLASEAK